MRWHHRFRDRCHASPVGIGNKKEGGLIFTDGAEKRFFIKMSSFSGNELIFCLRILFMEIFYLYKPEFVSLKNPSTEGVPEV